MGMFILWGCRYAVQSASWRSYAIMRCERSSCHVARGCWKWGAMPNAWQDIDALIERRALQLRKVDQKMERWLLIDGRIVAIDQALAALRNHPDANVELFGSVLRDLRKQVAELLEGYSRLAARFARQSVAIGVSGPARVGKTALIQTLSGLEDEQIPTGRGWLVIAPRIRFDHTKGRPRAVVQFHSEESFLKAVIDPLHSELGFLAMPASLNEFEAWRYPAGDEVRALVRPRAIPRSLTEAV